MVTFINGEFTPAHKAVISVCDLSIQRGYGIFDFFRCNGRIPLYVDDYLNRFYRSAEGLRLSIPYNSNELKNIIHELIERNDMGDSGIRMLLTGGNSSDSYTPASPNFIIIQQPLLMPDETIFSKGLNIMLHEYMRELPKIKSINYLVGIWMQDKINQKQANEVLYTKDGLVLEFPRSNVFIVTKENHVITPAENVLDGITRMKVLEIAAEKYAVETRNITIAELLTAKEVFLTSTTKRLLPVVSIEDKIIGDGKPGSVTTALLYEFIERENVYVSR